MSREKKERSIQKITLIFFIEARPSSLSKNGSAKSDVHAYFRYLTVLYWVVSDPAISIMDICDSHNYSSVCQENEQGYQSFSYQVVVLYPLIVEDLEYFLYKVSWIFVTLTMMVPFARKMSKATSHFPISYRHYSIKEP